MKTIWLPDATPRERRLAVGEFDGVHVGHREVIRGADTVLTFEPHPRTVVMPDSAPKLITALETKADLIAGLGVQELVVIPFDGAFAAQTPQAFIDDVLVADLGDAYCEQLRRTAIGPFELGDADPNRIVPLADVLQRILPSVRLDGADARRAAHGACVGAVAPAGAADVLLLDDEGPIAIAQPRAEGLKPVVGFRA